MFGGVFRICATKGQINVEYFLSIFTFVIFAVYIVFEVVRFSPLYINEIDREILRSEAYQLSEILVNDAGSPSNWETHAVGDIVRLGLSAEAQNKTNFLSMSKITSLDSYCSADYNKVAQWLDAYDYFSIVVIDSTTSSIIANCQPPTETPVGETNITVRRIVTFDSGEQPTMWLSGWNYRKSHKVTSTGSPQTDYQMRIKVHRTTGMDIGEDVYVGTNCLGDFGDIRFTDSNGVTQLDYWLETIDGNVATFWVKIPNIPVSPGTETVYVYYGKGVETTTSNGDATFEFFDGFSGSAIDTSKWTEDTDRFLISDGTLINSDTNDYRLRTISSFSAPGILEIKHKTGIGGTPNNGYQIGGLYSSTSDNYGYLQHAIGDYIRIDSSWTSIGSVIPENVWMLVRHKYYGTTVDSEIINYYTGASYVSRSGDAKTVSGEFIAVGKRYDNVLYNQAYLGNWDWVRIRKYVSPEPTHGDWGGEEVKESIVGGNFGELIVQVW